MKKSDLKAFIKEEILNEMALQEMAKISGDLKSSIEKVIQSNPDLETLPLKKAIKADAEVQAALGGDSLFDNQLNKFIALTKGEREVGQRGRKKDPNKPTKTTTGTGRKGRPKSDKKKDPALATSKLGGRKYYTKKTQGSDDDGPTDAELRKLAKSGGELGGDKLSILKQQEKSKLVKAFLKDLKDKGIVDTSNKVLDKEKYDAAWTEEKPKIQAKVSQINENFERRDPNYYVDMLDNLIQDYPNPKIQAKARILSAELMDILNNPGMFDLDEASKEEVDNQRDLNKELEKTSQLKKNIGLGESKKK